MFNSDYNINSITGLEESAGVLASCNQSISNNIFSLRHALDSINQNWENPDGIDLNSINTNLNDVIKALEEEVQPLIKGYVETLYNIASETKRNQQMSVF